MAHTQPRPLQPPIKVERLLPTSCVRYTQMKSRGSEESQHGFATAVGPPILAQLYLEQPQDDDD
jgi:hypothetical protein